MRLYALIEACDPETIDLFLTEEEAQRALAGCLREWRGLLRVEDVGLERLAFAELQLVDPLEIGAPPPVVGKWRLRELDDLE